MTILVRINCAQAVIICTKIDLFFYLLPNHLKSCTVIYAGFWIIEYGYEIQLIILTFMYVSSGFECTLTSTSNAEVGP